REAVKEDEEEDDGNEAAEGGAGHKGAGGSTDMYHNMSQGDWQVCQACLMDQQDEQWGRINTWMLPDKLLPHDYVHSWPLAIVAALPTALMIAFLNDRSSGESSKISALHQMVIWWVGLMRGVVSIALAFKQ
nr:sodium/hydrogen exchanger 4-like isoform X2 [Tanacetum cinerariifolium]